MTPKKTTSNDHFKDQQGRAYEDGLKAVQQLAILWADRELSGELSAEDRAELNAWLEADPRNELEYELALGSIGSEEIELALHYAETRSTKRALRFLGPILGIVTGAAALALAIIVVPMDGGAPDEATLAPFRQAFSTMPGAGEEIVTPDGTVIALNGGSKISLDYSVDERRVELPEGDAHFVVASNLKRPFLIEAANLNIRVTGTAFSVTQADRWTMVEVTEGSVDVSFGREMPNQTMNLMAGDVIQVSLTGESERWHLDDGHFRSWQDGWVDTASMTLDDLRDLVYRRTGTEVHIGGDLADRTISGRFRIDDPEVTFKRLSRIMNAEVVDTATGIELKPLAEPQPR